MKFQNRIFYELTHKCNLKCKHCCNSTINDMETLSSAAIDQFQFIASQYGIMNSVLTGGEPTMHPEFFEILDCVASYGNVVVTTNGTYLKNDDYVGIIEKYPNVFLQVSLDGFSKESNDAIRGVGTFDRVMCLLKSIIDAKKSQQLCISCVITKNNLEEIMDMIRFVIANKISSIYFPKLISSGRGYENWVNIAPSIDEQISIERSIIQEIAEDESEVISLNRLEHILTSFSDDIIDGQCVFAPKVSPDGYLYPCPLSMGRENRIMKIEDCKNFDSVVESLGNMCQEQYELKFIDSFCKKCDISHVCKKNYCEICKFNLASKQITNSEKLYQCNVYKCFYKEILDEVK